MFYNNPVMEPQISALELEIILTEMKKCIDSGVLGDVVEFGCFEGATSIHLAKNLAKTGRKLYVYDSFEGLPEKSYFDKSSLGENFKSGELNVSKKQFIRNIQKYNVPVPIIVKGWFNELNESHVPGRICFAFLDGDYYDSIHSSFKLIVKKLQSGSVVIIHDYLNLALPGVKKAVDEISEKNNFKITRRESLAVVHL